MSREDPFPGIVAVILVAIVTACGGSTTGAGRLDVGDAAVEGAVGSGGTPGGGGTGPSGGGRIGRGGSGGSDPAACDAGNTTGHGLLPCRGEAGVDGGVSQMSCSDLQTAWSSFARAHSDCTTDADCTTFEAIAPGWSPCDAPPGLNRAINSRFINKAQLYADRYFQLACGGDEVTRPSGGNGLWSDIGFDQSALMNPMCISGSCSAETLACNPEPPLDAGGDQDAATCKASPLPTCYYPSNGCAPDWATALDLFSPCEWRGVQRPFLAHCGPYFAVVVRYIDGWSVSYFADTGKLVGKTAWAFPGPDICEAYDPSFTGAPVEACTPIAGYCLPDGGTRIDARDASPG